LEAPLDLRSKPQIREFSGLKPSGLEAAETLLMSPQLLRVRNGSETVSSEGREAKGVEGRRWGGRRQRDIGERGREGGRGEGEGGG